MKTYFSHNHTRILSASNFHKLKKPPNYITSQQAPNVYRRVRQSRRAKYVNKGETRIEHKVYYC
jgi:hypothetical protein